MEMSIKKLLNEYRELGNSNQHKDNVDFAEDFLNIMNDTPLTEEDPSHQIFGRLSMDVKAIEHGLVLLKQLMDHSDDERIRKEAKLVYAAVLHSKDIFKVFVEKHL
jgi:hypothetical protein